MKFQMIYQVRILDRYTGIGRAWGLILYGCLPACLANLGLFKIEIQDKTLVPEVATLFAIVPLSVLFLLIREKQKKWFLDQKYLCLRSVAIMCLILTISVAICGLSLLLVENYQLDFSKKGINQGLYLSFLMSISSLVLSSTLFLTTLTKKVDLPGIPSNDMVEEISSIRLCVSIIYNDKVWKTEILEQVSIEELLTNCKDAKSKVSQYNQTFSGLLEEPELASFIDGLIEKLEDIQNGKGKNRELRIRKYFSKFWHDEKYLQSFPIQLS